jgi:23S rRNA (adenine2503-C2)-methyltransferase
MYELAERKYAITLALSLHATTDEKRRQIMPIANKYSLEEILDACRYYFDRTGRRITFEYSLIEGVNDTDEDIEGLIRIAGSVTSHINLIPVNPIAERKYRATSPQAALALKNKLEKNHINVTIRREMGRDISASCGQLRRSFIKDADTGDQNA